MIPTKCTIEGSEDLVMRNVHHKPRKFILLISIVDSEILPEGCELVDGHRLVGEEVLREF